MVSATVPWTPALAAAEADFKTHAVVATVLGNRPRFTVQDISVAASMQFGVPRSRMHVSVFSPGDFLIRFTDRLMRDIALAEPSILRIGGAVLRLSAWSRRVGATLVRLPYKARVCLEGPPRQARSFEGVRQLFPPPAIIDHIEDGEFGDEESACCCVWVWVQDPSKIATRGCLTLEEPPSPESPAFHRRLLGEARDEAAAYSSKPVDVLAHPVLLHLDQIHDYTVVLDSGDESMGSVNSDISGLPSEVSPVREDCIKWGYRWFLHFEDGTFPPPQRRSSVHSRLSFGGGDGGGGQGAGGGRGHGQAPPPRRRRYADAGGGDGSASGGPAAGGHADHGRRRERHQVSVINDEGAANEKDRDGITVGDEKLGPQPEAMHDGHVQDHEGFIEGGERRAPGSSRLDDGSGPVPIPMSPVLCPSLPGGQEHGMGVGLEELLTTPIVQAAAPAQGPFGERQPAPAEEGTVLPSTKVATSHLKKKVATSPRSGQRGDEAPGLSIVELKISLGLEDGEGPDGEGESGGPSDVAALISLESPCGPLLASDLHVLESPPGATALPIRSVPHGDKVSKC